MRPIIDEIKPYRLEAMNIGMGDAWRYIIEFGEDKLETYWRIMNGMNKVNKGLLLQIVPNFSATRDSHDSKNDSRFPRPSSPLEKAVATEPGRT